ncbi:MAG TPA: 50S ribosomal protein L9 [Spirochaetota bacterium]|nr:50S ribosomal protein L9 [Spirochaetota bacterium]HOL56396.1 50S ribosomal protein L9 [Spirochaetota bacterium]HPP05279.1 50S ribosomal protein L9 [Spirochaetota bacterium]
MATIKVILKKDVPNLGEEGDVKVVKAGYARNFLFPKGFAVDYSLKNRNALEKQKDIIEKKRLAKKENAKELKEKLDNVKISISIQAGEKGRLYGTVTTSQVEEELQKLGFNIDKKKIEIRDHIKVAGTYKAYIHIYQDISATIEMEIIPKYEEKKQQPQRQKGFKKRRNFQQENFEIKNESDSEKVESEDNKD